MKMIQVVDNDVSLDLNDLWMFIHQRDTQHFWEVFDLEYSGGDFEIMSHSEVEQKSRAGIVLSAERFSLFIQSISQIIEGTFVAKPFDESEVNGNQVEAMEPLIKVVICDGCFWEIGGLLGKEFISSTGSKLSVLK